MTAGVPLIDLDRTPPPAATEPAGPRVRPLMLLALVAAVLFTLGGDVAVSPGLTPVLTADPGIVAFELGTGFFFTAEIRTVRGFGLPGGAPRWTHAFAQDLQYLAYDDDAHVLLAFSGRDPRPTALDAASGRALWADETPDMLVVAANRGGVLTRIDPAEGPTRLLVRDARTGRPIWTRSAAFDGYRGPDQLFVAGSSRIVAVYPDGAVTVSSFADGSLLARGDLGPPFERDAAGRVAPGFATVDLVGGRLYVSRQSGARSSLTAFSLQPVARLWQADGGPVGTVADCGVVLCVAGAGSVSGVDPAGGAVLWSRPPYASAVRYAGPTLFASEDRQNPDTALLDATTGRVLRRLGHSRQLGGLVLRTDRGATVRTWVLAPDPQTGGVRVLGSFDGVASETCLAITGYLACPTTQGATTVWRLR
jgi:outer membrane protein assembly factor BamB